MLLKHCRLLIVLFLSAFIFVSCYDKPFVKNHGVFAPSRLDHVIGQDGVSSIEFSDNITLWTFADTILGTWNSEKKLVSSIKEDAQMETMIPNSLAWTDKISNGNYKNIQFNFVKERGRVAPFIRNRRNENPLKHRFWALDGIRIGNKVYVYYAHVFVPDAEKLLEFDLRYIGLARWDIPVNWKPGDPVGFKRLGKVFRGSVGALGSAVMERGGYIYLAGHLKSGRLEFPVRIARVKKENIEDPGQYEFLKEDGLWSGDLKTSALFFKDVSGECSLSYNEYLKSFVIIYARVFTGEIIMVRFKNFGELAHAEKKVIHRAPVKPGPP